MHEYHQHEYGQLGWQGRRSLSNTYEAEALRYAEKVEQNLWQLSSARDLSFVEANEPDTFAAYSQYQTAPAVGTANPLDFSAVPVAGSRSNTAYLLDQQQQIVALDQLASGSESGKRRYAHANFLLAGNILGAGVNSRSYAVYSDYSARETALFTDLRALANVLSATEMSDLAYETFRMVSEEHGGGSTYRVDYGKFGNFGEQKYFFAQAFLNSSLEQRLEYLGIDAQAWSMASPFVSAGLQGEAEARAIKDEEFGFDDFVKLGIAGGFIAAGFLFPPAGAGASILATAATAGVSAGLTALGTVFAVTGDLKTAMKAGASSFITGGVAKFAGQFTGNSRVIADAFSRGVINELSGNDFVDGVMSSVLQRYGAELGQDLTARLQGFGPEFVADLGGKMLESAILNEGNLSNFDDILKNYVLSYASGEVNSRLATVFGSQSSQHYGDVFHGVGNALVNGGGSALTDYLGSSAFLNSLGEGVSIDVVEYFGGADSFRGEVLSQLARAAIISGGDPDRMVSSAITIGQGLLAEYSADALRTGLSHGPAEVADRAETLTELLEVGITSGWDASTMRGYATGPLLESLMGSRQTIHGVPVGEQTLSRFLLQGIHMLADSYERHGGDLDAVAADVSVYLGSELARFSATQPSEPVYEPDTASIVDDVPAQGGDVAAVGGEIAYVHPGVIDRHSSAELITQLQGRLSDLASSTNNTNMDPGPVDGLWGTLTAAGLRGFQEQQLELLNKALDELVDLPESHYLPLIEQRNDLLVEINWSRAGSVSGVLLTEPLTAIDMNTLVGEIREGSSILPANATASELALFIEQSLNASEDGFITVDSNSGQLGGFTAERIRAIIDYVKERPELLQETVGRLSSSTLQLWADGVNSLSPSEVDEFVGLIATQLSADQLNAFFAGMNHGAQDALVEAIFASDDAQLIEEFSKLIASQTDTGANTSDTAESDSSLISDIGHFALDVIGLVPVVGEWADGLNATWYASEGRYFEAALSGAAVIPLFGISATITKWFGKTRTMAGAEDLAATAVFGPQTQASIQRLRTSGFTEIADAAGGAIHSIGRLNVESVARIESILNDGNLRLAPRLRSDLTSALNSLPENVKDKDLSVAMQELMGIPTGFDHVGELNQALNSIENARKSMVKALINAQYNNVPEYGVAKLQLATEALEGMIVGIKSILETR